MRMLIDIGIEKEMAIAFPAKRPIYRPCQIQIALFRTHDVA